MKRNNSLDCVKFIFTLIIVLHHFQPHINVKAINLGYICVEMFFMISGFFLYKDFKNNSSSQSATEYTLKRVKKMFPIYVVGLSATLLIKQICDFSTYNFVEFFRELFLIQGTGISFGTGGNLNGHYWYLSVMIIGGYFIYYLLCRDKEKYLKFTAPLIIILTYAFLNGKLENWSNFLFFHLPMWRGIAAMSIGTIIAYYIDTEMFIKAIKQYNNNKYLFWFLETILYIVTVCLIIFKNNYEFLSILLFPMVIVFTQMDNSLINKLVGKKVFSELNQYSYAIYIMQLPVILVVDKLKIDSAFFNTIILYTTLFVISILMNKLFVQIKQKLKF